MDADDRTAENPPEPTGPPALTRSSKRRRTLLALAVVAVVAVIVALALGWAAQGAYHSSFDRALPVEYRAAAASRAHALAPWNAAYEQRSRMLAVWVLGEQQLARGDYEAAVATLDTAYRLDVGDPELLALDHQAQDAQALATNRKAHLQHGHEGPGGTLRPQDVER